MSQDRRPGVEQLDELSAEDRAWLEQFRRRYAGLLDFLAEH